MREQHRIERLIARRWFPWVLIAVVATFAIGFAIANFFRDDADTLREPRATLTPSALLDADGGNFGHDVFGIRQHLNRETGELGECFLPRMAEARP